jgi:hypothetical protein
LFVDTPRGSNCKIPIRIPISKFLIHSRCNYLPLSSDRHTSKQTRENGTQTISHSAKHTHPPEIPKVVDREQSSVQHQDGHLGEQHANRIYHGSERPGFEKIWRESIRADIPQVSTLSDVLERQERTHECGIRVRTKPTVTMYWKHPTSA